MQVTVKLFANLGRYLPPGTRGNAAVLEVEEGTTPLDVLRRLALPPEVCQLLLVDGHYLAPGERGTRALADGEALAVWPPIAGG